MEKKITEDASMAYLVLHRGSRGGFEAWQAWQLPCLSQTWQGQSYKGLEKKPKKTKEMEVN